MLQINYIRQNADAVKERLALRNYGDIGIVDDLILLDEEIRRQKSATENLQASVNTASKETGTFMSKGNIDEGNALRAKVGRWKEELSEKRAALQQKE